jgi:hypothetical protein
MRATPSQLQSDPMSAQSKKARLDRYSRPVKVW